MKLVELNLGHFKQSPDFEDLRGLWNSIQLMIGNGEVGAWCLLDFLVANLEEFVLKVASDGWIAS